MSNHQILNSNELYRMIWHNIPNKLKYSLHINHITYNQYLQHLNWINPSFYMKLQIITPHDNDILVRNIMYKQFSCKLIHHGKNNTKSPHIGPTSHNLIEIPRFLFHGVITTNKITIWTLNHIRFSHTKKQY